MSQDASVFLEISPDHNLKKSIKYDCHEKSGKWSCDYSDARELIATLLEPFYESKSCEPVESKACEPVDDTETQKEIIDLKTKLKECEEEKNAEFCEINTQKDDCDTQMKVLEDNLHNSEANIKENLEELEQKNSKISDLTSELQTANAQLKILNTNAEESKKTDKKNKQKLSKKLKSSSEHETELINTQIALSTAELELEKKESEFESLKATSAEQIISIQDEHKQQLKEEQDKNTELSNQCDSEKKILSNKKLKQAREIDDLKEKNKTLETENKSLKAKVEKVSESKPDKPVLEKPKVSPKETEKKAVASISEEKIDIPAKILKYTYTTNPNPGFVAEGRNVFEAIELLDKSFNKKSDDLKFTFVLLNGKLQTNESTITEDNSAFKSKIIDFTSDLSKVDTKIAESPYFKSICSDKLIIIAEKEIEKQQDDADKILRIKEFQKYTKFADNIFSQYLGGKLAVLTANILMLVNVMPESLEFDVLNEDEVGNAIEFSIGDSERKLKLPKKNRIEMDKTKLNTEKDELTPHFASILSADKIDQMMLFYGPSGSGKTFCLKFFLEQAIEKGFKLSDLKALKGEVTKAENDKIQIRQKIYQLNVPDLDNKTNSMRKDMARNFAVAARSTLSETKKTKPDELDAEYQKTYDEIVNEKIPYLSAYVTYELVAKGCISQSPNNPESSRCATFYFFTKGSNRIVFMDAPGSELPQQIVDQFYGTNEKGKPNILVEKLMTSSDFEEDWQEYPRARTPFTKLVNRLKPYDAIYKEAGKLIDPIERQVSVHKLAVNGDADERHDYVRRLVRQGRYINLLIGEMTRKARNSVGTDGKKKKQELQIKSPFNIVKDSKDTCDVNFDNEINPSPMAWQDGRSKIVIKSCRSILLCEEFTDDKKFLFDHTNKCSYKDNKNPIDEVEDNIQNVFPLDILGFGPNTSVNSYLVIPTKKQLESEKRTLEQNLPILYDQIVGEIP